MSAETFDKDILVKNIKDWVMIDDELNKMKKQIKEYNLQKKQITSKLVQTMKHKNIDCFEINSGTLVYKQTKSKKSAVESDSQTESTQKTMSSNTLSDDNKQMMTTSISVNTSDINMVSDY